MSTSNPNPVAAEEWVPQMRRSDGSLITGWALLPLRLFLGITFTFAGLQKLSNPNFFHNSSPNSIHAQLLGSVRTSPIHALIGGLVHVAPLVGVAIAVGEIAIGLGTLVGLWMRMASAAGMVLSLGLFLTVSFHASPYFTGADIVFLFAWTPLVIAGAAGGPALDTLIAVSKKKQISRQNARSRVGISRRDVISKGTLAGGSAAVVLALGGVTAIVGRIFSSSSPSTIPEIGSGSTTTSSTSASTTTPSTSGTGSTTTTAPPKPAGTAIGPSDTVPVGGSAVFTDPASGDPALVIQRSTGEFKAFDAICPHAGCTVAYQPSAQLIACPCHGSEFNPHSGAVLNGPATQSLRSIRVVKGADGQLYVDG